MSTPRSSCVPFPTDADDDTSCGDPSSATEASCRPRPRTSTLAPPRRAYAPKLHAARVPIRKQPHFTYPYSPPRCTSSPASIKPLTAADLRLTALIERNIALTLSRHADNPNSSLSDLEQHDLVLCEHLQALLALHGRHLHACSPTRTSTGIVPPACAPSVLLSWSEGVDTTSLPLSTPALPPALRFITATRARSSARGSAGGNGAGLEMAALVATLLQRRREGKGQMGAGTKRAFVPRASKLHVAS